MIIPRKSFEQARNHAQNLPALDRLKFEVPSIGTPDTPLGATEKMWGWSPIKSRLPQSALFGETVSWQFKDQADPIFSYRVDRDPVKKAHINVMVIAPETPGGQRHPWKAAITFDCGGLPCSADEVKRLARSNFMPRSP